MALPSINDLKMWVGTLFTKDDWDYNFSQLVSWLADGNSDLVVNSVKATNGIDLDGAQIINVGAATSGSQAVNLDQATTLLNRTSYYQIFSAASGKVNSNGDAAFLQKDSDTQVTVLAGNTNPDLVCICSDGTIESVTSNTVLTVPNADGTYYIVKEKESAISITSSSSNKMTVSKKFPTSPNIGDYFLDNSVLPYVGYKYTVNGWEETPFCYLGYVIVSGGVATCYCLPYSITWNANIDGRPYTSYLELTALNHGVQEDSSDLYNYLPKDGALYMVDYIVQAVDDDSTKKSIYVRTDSCNPGTAIIELGGFADRARAFISMPTKRYAYIASSATVDEKKFYAIGYRRIGNNF